MVLEPPPFAVLAEPFSVFCFLEAGVAGADLLALLFLGMSSSESLELSDEDASRARFVAAVVFAGGISSSESEESESEAAAFFAGVGLAAGDFLGAGFFFSSSESD